MAQPDRGAGGQTRGAPALRGSRSGSPTDRARQCRTRRSETRPGAPEAPDPVRQGLSAAGPADAARILEELDVADTDGDMPDHPANRCPGLRPEWTGAAEAFSRAAPAGARDG